MKKIGIFGGTFNPPHIAHSIIAEDVREQLNLDKIIFIPSGIPPLKKGKHIIPAVHRFNMSKLAFGNNKYFEVSNIEIKKTDEKSYTFKTLLELKKIYNNAELFLIVGVDNILEFKKWKNPVQLFELAKIVVMNRPGYPLSQIDEKYFEKILLIDIPLLDISSTQIRKYVARKKSIRYLVSGKVEKYIFKNKLYIK